MSSSPLSRRAAVERIAGTVTVLAGAAAVSGCAGTGTAASVSPAGAARSTRAAPKWDMSWQQRLTGTRRVAFDTNEVSSGAALSYVEAYRSGAKEAYGDDAQSVVLVLRHASVPIALGDAVWETLGLGEQLKLKDPTTGEPAKRNPFVNYRSGDKYSMIDEASGLDALIRAGVVVLACNRAFTGYTNMFASKAKLDRDAARAQVLASMVPGVYLMPNGVFAIAAAQHAGCDAVVVR